MAITKIWNVKSDTKSTLSYVVQKAKTQDGALAFSGNCSPDPDLANLQMRMHRRKYGKDSGNLLFHGCVSFQKGEIDVPKAYQYAKEWMEWKFHNYQYLVGVHVDTDHLHFNFVINAVDLDGKKYNDCNRTLAELRAWTDTLCERYQLSVIRPKGKGVSYKKWMDEKKQPGYRQQVRDDIDVAIATSKTFDGFIDQMKSMGYFVKYGEQYKHIVFKLPDRKGVRGATLGSNYSEEAIRERIFLNDFQVTSVKAQGERRWHTWTRLQKEQYRLEHIQRPYLSTVLALGVHMLLDHWKSSKDRISAVRRPYWKNQYAKEVNQLSALLVFVQQNRIETVAQLKETLRSFEEESKELREELKQKKAKNKEETDLLRKKLRECKAKEKQCQSVLNAYQKIQTKTLYPEWETREEEHVKKMKTEEGREERRELHGSRR